MFCFRRSECHGGNKCITDFFSHCVCLVLVQGENKRTSFWQGCWVTNFTYCNVTILPVVTKYLLISPRYSPPAKIHRDASSALLHLANYWLKCTYYVLTFLRFSLRNTGTELKFCFSLGTKYTASAFVFREVIPTPLEQRVLVV